jgi:glucoside 3-dehydrogenase (cytochrome c) hitch-hiker subunit
MPDESASFDATTSRQAREEIGRREAIRRVTTILGGVALVGGGSLMAACEKARNAPADSAAAAAPAGPFTAADVAYLDEIADTILPDTKTPGAKAAKVGSFMALMVTDGYDAREQRIFRDGMRTLDAASQKASGAPFMKATPAERLALLQMLDREQKAHTDAREAARTRARGAPTAAVPTAPESGPHQPGTTAAPDQRAQNATATPSASAPGEITADSPAHYFRMMKELALLGYFTSEIGYTQAMRYVESPGRFDPCAPYTPGDKAWAPHA